MPLNAPPIVKLPESLIDQIAAGEVIEGPLSVVKELVENALDANASTIDIHIQGGGYSEIVISDNGWGISCHDLPLALLKHATSKMTEETLWNIRSLGFRGEALSVIRAVSRLRLESRTLALRHHNTGARLAWFAARLACASSTHRHCCLQPSLTRRQPSAPEYH